MGLQQWFATLFIVFQLFNSISAERIESCQTKKSNCWSSTTARLLRSSGYEAEDHYLRVQDGRYTLDLVKATNPLVVNAGLPVREPLLFVHCLNTDARSWFVFHDKVRPRDYTRAINITSIKEDQLFEKIGADEGSKSLVFTALNFGYEVWLINRRSTFESLWAHALFGKPGLGNSTILKSGPFPPVPPKYFDFSFDEQVGFDLPATIDYVLEATKRKQLGLVGFSEGATIPLMLLADRPEYAKKITKAIFWGLIFDSGQGLLGGIGDKVGVDSLPILSAIKTPVPPVSAIEPIKEFAVFTCTNVLLRPLSCNRILDRLTGKGTNQLVFPTDPPFPVTNSLSEYAQLLQSEKLQLMHHYEYPDKSLNMRAYKKATPPVYDVSRVTLRTMSFWFGTTDQLGRAENFVYTKKRLTVPFEEKIIGDKRVKFNHIAFVFHKDIAKLLILPSMRKIASSN